MVELMDTFSYKLRVLAVGILIIASLLLLTFLLSMLSSGPTVQAVGTDPYGSEADTTTSNSPNVITEGMFNVTDVLGRKSRSTDRAINSTFRSATGSVVGATAQSGKFAAHSVGSGASFMAQTAGNGFAFTIHTTGHVLGLIASTPTLSSIIRPADKTPVPVIKTSTPALASYQTTLPAIGNAEQTKAQAQIESEASWPIHGEITTEFGVPHWPYQPTHTGIDISDLRPSGVTPIFPFKPGVVIEVVHSNVSFGNHVIIDHGGGITSLYGHLAFISVQVGQKIDKNTILGYEGSTGASTGTHLHFEIRLNGQPVNPHQYVSGQP